jgi:hypothetical protein
VWLFPNKTLFLDTEIWILYDYMVIEYHLSLIGFNNFKMLKKKKKPFSACVIQLTGGMLESLRGSQFVSLRYNMW